MLFSRLEPVANVSPAGPALHSARPMECPAAARSPGRTRRSRVPRPRELRGRHLSERGRHRRLQQRRRPGPRVRELGRPHGQRAPGQRRRHVRSGDQFPRREFPDLPGGRRLQRRRQCSTSSPATPSLRVDYGCDRAARQRQRHVPDAGRLRRDYYNLRLRRGVRGRRRLQRRRHDRHHRHNRLRLAQLLRRRQLRPLGRPPGHGDRHVRHPLWSYVGDGYIPGDAAVVDFNGDGRLDIATATDYGYVSGRRWATGPATSAILVLLHRGLQSFAGRDAT